MATTSTTFSPAPVIEPFTGLGDMFDRTNVPRAEVQFKILGGIITAGGANDQAIDIACDLPQNFSYALSEIEMAISGADAVAWDTVALGVFSDGPSATRTYNACTEGLSNGVSNNTSTAFGPVIRVWDWDHLPKVIMVPRGADVGRLTVKVGNSDVGDVAMKVNFFARFFMYDIEQAHNFEVNTPLAVR